MQIEKDTYKTVLKPSNEVLFKEKKSKFYSYVFPIQKEEDAKPIIEELRKKHHTANHVCYAWQLGVEKVNYRANDDGEPNNSAGMPIYGQIKSFNVTNVLIAVVRIFGGTKLGVGGLISAYRNSAELALNEAKIVEQILTNTFEITFDYKEMDKVMRIIKQNQLQIVSQKMEMNCSIHFSVRKKDSNKIETIFKANHEIKIKKISL
ncbi:putative YigZ family protein [Maribacter vaceletii]|uniref:Putative YigZ family protein n=1 Tax=Maribacter vaceletii TaxID=1206816 RepID=A0A495EA61_9FLAO|nr:YigZ family protein [Maribacter vaceletii]RKR13403.1 putative YigZ family protein [Maribacter vaceletii]